jgi:RNA polymerase sigma-70 factor (ECF subfamily)
LHFEGSGCFWPSGVREIQPGIMPALGSLFATLGQIERIGPNRMQQGDQLQILPADNQSASPVTPSAAVSNSAPSAVAASLTDEEVVARVCAGDTQIFEILMRRYNQRLYRAARAILQSDADAEDAVQQAYLNAYRHLAQFEGRARFSTWLTRITVYEALARRRRSRDKLVESSDEEHVKHVASATPDPEHHAYVGQLGALLETALAALPDGYRSVFMLREVDGLNTAQTAQQLRLSEGTVKTRLHRAKDLLQRKLHDVTPAAAFRFDGELCDRLVAAVMSHLTVPRLV